MYETISDITVEKQIGTSFCWAAAAHSVLTYYGIKITQKEIITGKETSSGGSPARILEQHGVLKKQVKYPFYPINNAQAGARAIEVRKMLKEEIRGKRPVILGIYNSYDEKSQQHGFDISQLMPFDFGHCVVAFGYKKENRKFRCLDPGRPSVNPKGTSDEMVSGWYIYGDHDFAMGRVMVHLRYLFLTQKP
jgi:hypothetical protein